MSNIIDISEYKKGQTPHITGEAFCIVCNHEWVAVVPAGDGVLWLDCPNCHTEKGLFRFHCDCMPNEPQWVCNNCGGVLFVVIKTGLICVNCGTHTLFEKII